MTLERLTKLCSREWLAGVYFSRQKTRCREHRKEQLALEDSCRSVGRRAFLKQGTLILLASASSPLSDLWADDDELLKVGLVTDLHYADKPTRGTRHYRETLSKLEAAADRFRQEKPDFIAELGDFIDAADSVAKEQSYLKTINRLFVPICEDRHYVLGNHCVDTLKKDEFLGAVEQNKSFYSFDRQGIHLFPE